MKKKITKHVKHESKSLKTFYLYTLSVFALILISLLVKLFFVYEQSKFDPAHDFVLAIMQQNKVKEIVAFHPESPSIAFLQIQDKALRYDTLAKNYGIATDGYVVTQDNTAVGTNMTSFMWSALLHTTTWESNLTILDKFRLMLLAKNVGVNNKNIQQISLSQQTPDTNTIIATALTDQDFASENISIQIINATNVSGLAQRLGKVLTNLGANVVDVSSAQHTQQKSTIAYFGDESYTVDRLQKFLGVSATKLTKQTIADIVITIGNDKRKTNEF